MDEGGLRVVDRLADAGLGLRYGDALVGYVTLIREATAERVQHIQLPRLYAPLRTANRRFWLALLRARNPRLTEQVLLANVVEAYVSDWLPDENVLKVEGSNVTASFARHLNTMLVRTEAVEALEALQQRARTTGALASELVRQARRHALAQGERERFLRFGRKVVGGAESVVRMLTTLARLGSPSLDEELETQANVPNATVIMSRLQQTPSPALTKVWKQWRALETQRGGGGSGGGMGGGDEEEKRTDGLLLAMSRPPPVNAMARAQALTAATEPVEEPLGSPPPYEEEEAPPARASTSAWGAQPAAATAAARTGTGTGTGTGTSMATATGAEEQDDEAGTTRVATLTLRGKLANFSLQDVLEALARALGSTTQSLQVLVVREAKAGRGSGVVTDFALPTRLALALWARARSGALGKDLVLAPEGVVSLEVQALGKVDGNGEPMDPKAATFALDTELTGGGGGSGGGGGGSGGGAAYEHAPEPDGEYNDEYNDEYEADYTAGVRGAAARATVPRIRFRETETDVLVGGNATAPAAPALPPISVPDEPVVGMTKRLQQVLPEIRARFNARAGEFETTLDYNGALATLLDLGCHDASVRDVLEQFVDQGRIGPRTGLALVDIVEAYAAVTDIDLSEARVPLAAATATYTAPSRGAGSGAMGGGATGDMGDMGGVEGGDSETRLRKRFAEYTAPHAPDRITYLSLRTAVEAEAAEGRRPTTATHEEADLRRWLRDRDRTGKGYVDYADFKAAATANPAGATAEDAGGGLVPSGALGTAHMPWESDTALYLQDEYVTGDALEAAMPGYNRTNTGTGAGQGRPRASPSRSSMGRRSYESEGGGGGGGGGRSPARSPRRPPQGGQAQTQREWAIRRAFETYDLNGDGMITYLELRTVLMRQGREASESELRGWIRARDRSGNGAVSFADFCAAYEAK